MSGHPGKRQLDEAADDGSSKRVRSNNGSPAPAPPAPSSKAESDIERKKREAGERMAAVKAKLAASRQNGSSVTPTPMSASPAAAAAAPVALAANGASGEDARKIDAQRKIAEMKARMAAQRAQGGQVGSPVNGGAAAPPTAPPKAQPSDREARIAEARARAAELSKQRNKGPSPASAPGPPPRQDSKGARGGLGIGLHPSLMGDLGGSAAAKGKAAQQGPKFSTTKGNQRPEVAKVNPYIAEDIEESRPEQDDAYDPSLATRKGGVRQGRALAFNEKGKYMAQANALRQQAKLEEMKRRIAAETRKTEIEEASDKSFLVPAPPDVEWWDEGLLPEDQRTYEDCLESGRNRIETDSSIITNLIQHPVQIQPPQDKFIPAPKPLMLTHTEQRKLRRQRRMADMKEEQAKIRLGLVEPPPPKVKKSNMMRVLGEQAVKDPTAVEARVNREIAQRAADHDQANEDRKLTQEQRAEKLQRQRAGDEAKGVKVAVFRVDNLSSGKHRYQVDVNAKQQGMTGIVVLNPALNLVIVEGGAHSINAYKKLMLNRIKWSENTLPMGNTNPTTFTGSSEPKPVPEGKSKASDWCNPLDDNGELKDLSENRCVLVWEGDEQTRSFRKWGSRACETDGEAKDILSRQKMENMWTLAKSR